MNIEIEDDKQLEMVDEQKALDTNFEINEPSNIVQAAISKGITDVETLKALIEMKNAEEDRKAKKEFDFHFAEMQKEFTPIERKKTGYNFKYAELSELELKYRPIISKHGFSYKWKEEVIEIGKRVTIIISGYGHTDDSSFFDVPDVEATKNTNAIQTKGTMSTYGMRYTFKAGFGITEKDEDTDGSLNYEDGVEYSTDIKAIRTCTKEQLPELFSMIYKKYATDKIGREIIVKEKDKRKKELQ
jgi:hypothetical protein